jgi:hypothetical protein
VLQGASPGDQPAADGKRANDQDNGDQDNDGGGGHDGVLSS